MIVLFFFSSYVSCDLNAQALRSSIDSGTAEKIVLKVIPTISFLCAIMVNVVMWTLLVFYIKNNI